MSKEGNSLNSFSIFCPFLRKEDAKDIIKIIRLLFQKIFNISALNIILCIQCYVLESLYTYSIHINKAFFFRAPLQ